MLSTALEIHSMTQLYELPISKLFSLFGIETHCAPLCADFEAHCSKLEGGLVTLITGFLPSLVAKEALKARRVITDAFLKYYAEGGLEEASVYARHRYQYPSSLGVSLEDVAKM